MSPCRKLARQVVRIAVLSDRSSLAVLPAISVVDVDHYDGAGLIEAEEGAPLADAQATAALPLTFQRLDVAATVGKRFQGANHTLRAGGAIWASSR